MPADIDETRKDDEKPLHCKVVAQERLIEKAGQGAALTFEQFNDCPFADTIVWTDCGFLSLQMMRTPTNALNFLIKSPCIHWCWALCRWCFKSPPDWAPVAAVTFQEHHWRHVFWTLKMIAACLRWAHDKAGAMAFRKCLPFSSEIMRLRMSGLCFCQELAKFTGNHDYLNTLWRVSTKALYWWQKPPRITFDTRA